MITYNYVMPLISHYLIIIRQYEILKEGSPCTILKLHYNMQLRSQLYQLMYKIEAKMDKIIQVSSKNIIYFIDHISYKKLHGLLSK